MKLIIAIIQESRLDQVREALVDAEIFRITVIRCSGRGQQVSKEVYRGMTVTPELIPKVKLEIACNDNFVEPCVNAIIKGAKTGNVGDGKIFIMPLEECIRIRTGERGKGAI